MVIAVVSAVCLVRPATAQTSDLSILVGASAPAAGVSPVPPLVSACLRVGVQAAFGHKLVSAPAGDILLDVPFAVLAQQGEIVSRGVTVDTSGSVYFTPGVRFVVAPQARVAPYAALGVGFGSVEGSRVRVGPGLDVSSSRAVSGALGFGGGLDLRLTRPLSLCGEVRDVVTRAGLGAVSGRHHAVVGLGLGFHF